MNKKYPNTKRKTAYDVELFKSFILTSNPGLVGSTSRHELLPQVLNDLFLKFIFGVRKKDGSKYKPTSLRGFLSSIQRYLKKKKKNTASHFLLTLRLKLQWSTLKAKQKDIKAKGLGTSLRHRIA